MALSPAQVQQIADAYAAVDEIANPALQGGLVLAYYTALQDACFRYGGAAAEVGYRFRLGRNHREPLRGRVARPTSGKTKSGWSEFSIYRQEADLLWDAAVALEAQRRLL